MGIEKSELKKALLTEMGADAEERAEALEHDMFRMQGAAGAFKQAREKIESEIFAKLKRDLETDLDPEVAKTVDKYLRSCMNMMAHLEKIASTQVPLLNGRADEARNQVGSLGKQVKAEAAKIQTLRDAESSGGVQRDEDGDLEATPGDDRVSRRPVGVRPTSLKDQRQAEEAEDDGGSEETDAADS